LVTCTVMFVVFEFYYYWFQEQFFLVTETQ
jgi:hypothetical protein